MKRILALLVALLPLLAILACNQEKPVRERVPAPGSADDSQTDGDDMPTGHSPAGHLPAGHSSKAGKSAPVEIDVSGVKKADGGKTVGEVYTNKASLSGKKVTLRGKVVKFNKQIMGKNWLHVRDGSGDAAARTNDLTVTTGGDAKVGDTVLITGELHLDKDFGAGYKYDVIIEDARVTVE